jgi:DNA-binding SARP family transcriptional activator
MESRVSISVLGELRVQRDGQPVTLPPSKKTRALIAYLAVVQRPQRRERLCEIFWQIPDDPRGALRWSLSRIRKIVDAGEKGCLRADRNFVALDQNRFECDFRPIHGLTAEQVETLDIARMEALAESIYGGFLEDLYLANCPEFEAWRVAQAEQVEVIRLRLLRVLVDRLRSQPERALRHAHVLHALAPEPGLAEEIERLAARARQMAAAAPSAQTETARPAAVAEPPAASEEGTPRRATASQVRRQVSVLAAEVAAPQQVLHDEDPEAGIAILNPLVGTVRREVETCGGSVISATDASVVGIFGAALATEDHAFQACRAALAIKAEADKAGKTTVRLSIGLDTGETVLRSSAARDGVPVEVHGAVVSNARRLAQMLRRDAIASTARMNDALLGYVAASAMSDSDFSGGQPAGRCYEVLGRSQASTRWQLRRARGLAPLTGRVAELAFLNDAWQRVRAGTGQCIGIVGDAGIGKSRLVYELLTSAAVAGARIAEVGALESDAITSFHIVKKLLRSILGIEEADDSAAAAGKVAAGIASLGADPSLRSPLLFSLDIPPDDREWASLPVSERVRRVRNAASVVVALTAEARPLVVLVEDLHWIDADSASVLDRLIDSIATRRIFLLMTFRPDYHHAWGSRSNYSQMRLDPLPRGEAESLLRMLLGDDSSVRGPAAFIAERTDGVPLFIEETVQALAQSGALTGKPGAYAAGGEITSPRVPATIQSVIAARIDRLAPSERWLLQNAAIIGRHVSLKVLATVAGLDEEAASEGVLKLQSAGFLYETQLFPLQVFTFKHALVQKVAYDSLVHADRKLLHGRLIDALESTLPHLIDDYVEKLGEHAINAERWDKAVEYLLRSARRALQRSSHNLALSFLGKGLQILAKRPKSRERDRLELDYQKLAGVAWMAAKGWSAVEVLTAYERAEALCDALADETERFIALRGRAQYYMISGQPRSAQAISLRCADMTRHWHDTGVAIETHHMFWTNNFFMGACAAAENHAEEAIGLYDTERHHALTYQYSGHDPGVCSRCFSGLAAWHRGALGRASERCEEARALAERLSHPLTKALAYWASSCLGMLRREPEQTLAWARKEIAVCDEFSLPLLRPQGEFQVGWALAQLGDVAAGIAQMEQAVQGIRATGAEMGMPYLLGMLGETLASAGQRNRAIATLEDATASATHNGTHFLLSEVVRTKACLLAETKDGDAMEIDALFRSALDIATHQNAPLPALRVATDWARFLIRQRRKAQARAVLAPYTQLVANLPNTPDGVAAARVIQSQ